MFTLKWKKCTIHLFNFLFSILFIALCFFPLETGATETEPLLIMYQDYQYRFEAIEQLADVEENDFHIISDQVFLVMTQRFGEISFIPAMDKQYQRLIILLADGNGNIVYKTDELETNYRIRGQLKQPTTGIAAVSFQDVNGDELIDIVLITACTNETGTYAGKSYKVGDVLFQNEEGFYRDWRISDKINRFSMNKSIDFITAFIRDGYSTEFLYTATTLDELLENGLEIITEQSYPRKFEKLGKLQVIPGTYTMADYTIFMIFLVNEQGNIVWSFQPMGDFDNLYALKGINCKDIDGDLLKDVIILARYSYEGSNGEVVVESDYSIYYQRTAGFIEETDYKNIYQCNEEDTMAELVEKARAYWGWEVAE